MPDRSETDAGAVCLQEAGQIDVLLVDNSIVRPGESLLGPLQSVSDKTVFTSHGRDAWHSNPEIQRPNMPEQVIQN